MLSSDADRIATALQDEVGEEATSGISVTVKAERSQPKSTAPGAGRPTFARYYIRVTDGSREALLDLGQAETLLDDIEVNADADSVFEAIRSHDVPVEAGG